MSNSFFNTWSPYANQVGASTGISPNTILAQWALESGYGSSNAAQNYNLAGISPGGTLASYGSPDEFVSAYTGLLQNNFPGALNTGNDVSAFNNGLLNGTNGSYYTSSPSDYLSNLTQIANSLGGVNVPDYGTFQQGQPGITAPGPNTVNSGTSLSPGGATGWLASLETYISGGFFRFAIAVIAFILIAVGLASLISGKSPLSTLKSKVGKAARIAAL
jgi:hypothetical protein